MADNEKRERDGIDFFWNTVGRGEEIFLWTVHTRDA